MERLIIVLVKILVFINRFFKPKNNWSPDNTLNILLVGYNGARNTGADARVAEMVKQFQHLLKDYKYQITILTLNIENISCYYDESIKLQKMSVTFVKDVFRECRRNHIAVLCEGSTLKSQFSDMLTLAFGLAAGLMKSMNRPCLAYGSEAGDMSQQIYNAVKELCSETYFIARTRNSLEIIEQMGLKGHLGTDTAWPFQSPDSYDDIVIEELKKQGWDGEQELLGVCAINPFWWPVKPDMLKFLKSLVTHPLKLKKDPLNYKLWMYHQYNAQDKDNMNHYIDCIANAINKYTKNNNVFIALIGMEALDLHAIKDLKHKLNSSAGIFNSSHYDAYFLNTLLNKLTLLITSRYHARVLSLFSGVPAIAISMDERLKNIYSELDTLPFYLQTDDKDLEEKLSLRLTELHDKRDILRTSLKEKHSSYIDKFDEMGDFFLKYVKSNFPEL